MNEQFVYSTDVPEIVAAYREARLAYGAAGSRAHHAAIDMGCTGIFGSGSAFGPPEIVGLATDHPDTPPDGWRWLKSRNMLVPKRGKAGDVAREWEREYAFPKDDGRSVLSRNGLPRNSQVPSESRDFSFRVLLPDLLDSGDEIWALYTGKPGTWVGDETVGEAWRPRKLSEYHAAREAAEEAQAAKLAAVS